MLDLAAKLVKELSEYSESVKLKVDKCRKKIAKQTKEKLEERSPKRFGKYKASWTIKNIEDKDGNLSIVHNGKRYYLTHLLEHGHASVNGGRVKAIPHMAISEKEMLEEYLKELAEAINNE